MNSINLTSVPVNPRRQFNFLYLRIANIYRFGFQAPVTESTLGQDISSAQLSNAIEALQEDSGMPVRCEPIIYMIKHRRSDTRQFPISPGGGLDNRLNAEGIMAQYVNWNP